MKNVMKRLFAGTLALMMLFAMTGCKANALPLAVEEAVAMEEAAAPMIGQTVGGWNIAEDTELTDDQRSLFEKALEGLVGVGYEPVAYLGSQVVAGLNHCFLCKATVVYPGAEPAYKLVYIYESLDGNASLTDVADLDIAL